MSNHYAKCGKEKRKLRTLFNGNTLKVFTYQDKEGNQLYVFRVPPFHKDSTILTEWSIEALTNALMRQQYG